MQIFNICHVNRMGQAMIHVISCVHTYLVLLHETEKRAIDNTRMARYSRESLNKPYDDSVARIHNCIATYTL